MFQRYFIFLSESIMYKCSWNVIVERLFLLMYNGSLLLNLFLALLCQYWQSTIYLENKSDFVARRCPSIMGKTKYLVCSFLDFIIFSHFISVTVYYAIGYILYAIIGRLLVFGLSSLTCRCLSSMFARYRIMSGGLGLLHVA